MAGKGAVSVDVVIKEGKDGLKTLTLDADALCKIMESNIKVAQRFEKQVFGFAALSTSINAVNNAFGQLSSTLESITGESKTFDKAMREANTMAGKDSAGFKELKGDVAELAKEIPIARDLLANGLYQTISNGVPEDNWIEYLKTSARSAVGGLADINKVVGVTSTLIKNYGLEWGAAADIQDKIQLTAKNGVTSFEQLAQALPRVAGNAATLGVSIDELMGTFATLTGVSGNTAEVSTQLAAIFTSLVKPSSEAAKMAAEMGIQFDAAAIKAAGGFQNFLAQLDNSVKAYSQASGMLEQEVYGKLFGSAEALRALTPLQGELSEKFSANIANMVNSAGTMDAAYADMSSHGEAVNQMLRNQWAAVIDVVAGITSAAQPYINFASGLLSTGSSAAILVTTFKQLNVQQTLVAIRAKSASAAMTLLGLRGKSASAVVRTFSSLMKAGALSATALKVALRGLLIVTGVGAAIAAVTSIIGYFIDATDDATESVEKLDDATNEYTRAASAAKVQIDSDIKSLGELISAKKDTKDALERLNKTYGEFFGVQKTAEDMYKALTEKSQLYIKQIGYEAQARALASKIAKNTIDQELADKKKAEWESEHRNKMRRGTKDPVTGLTTMISSDDEWKQLRDNLSQLEDEGKEYEAILDKIKSKMEDIAKEAKIKPFETPAVSGETPETPKSKDRKAGEGSVKWIDERITKIKTEIEYAVDSRSRRKLYEELKDLEGKKWAIEFEYKGEISNDSKKILKDYISEALQKATVDIDASAIEMPALPGNIDKKAEHLKKINEQLALGNDLAGGMAGAFNSLGDAIKGATGEWLNYIGSFFSNASRLLAAIQAMTMGEAAHSAAQTPVIGWLQVGAAMAAVAASFASLPKFAEGGVVSGPTVGLIGEYAGASNNPEVVAPLDKLRRLMSPAGQPVIIGGTLRASGRDLVCVLANETRISSKSGRKTSIKI